MRKHITFFVSVIALVFSNFAHAATTLNFPLWQSALVPIAATETNKSLGITLRDAQVDPSNTSPHLSAPLTHFDNGNTVTLRILVPPGTSFATVKADMTNNVMRMQTCTEDNSVCWKSGDTIGYAIAWAAWPVKPAASNTDSTLTLTPQIVNLTLTPDGSTDVMSLYIKYDITNVAAYNTWRSTRSWAGGTGDCDGLNNRYCSADTTSPVTQPPVSTFTIAPSSATVSSSASFSVSANSGLTIASCSAKLGNGTAITMTNASGTAPTLAAGSTDQTATITCTSTAGTTASTSITIKAPTAPTTPKASVTATKTASTVNPGKLQLDVKLTPLASEAGKTSSFWVGADVNMVGWPGTANQALFMNTGSSTSWRSASTSTKIDFSDITYGQARAFDTTGVTMNVLNGELSEADLMTFAARLYVGYRLSNGNLVTYPTPVFDCSSGTACTINNQ